jgi:hypothetical protein
MEPRIDVREVDEQSKQTMMKMRIKHWMLVAGLLLGVLTQARSMENSMPLSGTWRFEIDRKDAGVQEGWFQSNLTQRIRMPGSMPEQNFGDDITLDTPWTGQIVDRSFFTLPEYAPYRQPGKIKVPFWLQPEKYYVGAAWYQRDVEVPSKWLGKRLVLSLERPHWETRVWLDDREIGSNNSLSTPHEYDLGTNVAPGRHRLSIRVDNRMVVDVGINSHSVTDHTQGNWNGIVGRLFLNATPGVWIEDLQAYPHVGTHSVTLKGRIGNATKQVGKSPMEIKARLFNTNKKSPLPAKTVEVSWDATGGTFEVEYDLGEKAVVWDEFQPALYQVTATLAESPATRSVVFGLREIGTQGTQFVLNGHPIFIRGTLECCIFPKTGHPPTEVDAWKRIVGIAKAHGLNCIRFHSWCPPEAAFEAADELGFYYQVECASWANTTTSLGEGKPIDAWLYAETDRILNAYGSHPSFLLMPYGNEPAGNDKAYLGAWVSHYKHADSRRLFTSASGWPQIPENQFHVTPDPRIQGWGAGLRSRINALPPETRTDYREYISQRIVPVISHEIGEWCVYPNFDEIPKYSGYLKAKNFEIFRDSLQAHKMGDQAHAFLLASGKLQTLCYKEEIESALRTPGMGGFQLLDLHDFPGQGTALVGVLDPFWDYKGYVTAAEYSRFCNSTVPLARLDKRVFTSGETLKAELEVAHFGAHPLTNATVYWKLVGDNEHVFFTGKLPPQSIPIGNGLNLGNVSIDLKTLPSPARFKLMVGVEETRFENDWDVWVYPARIDTQPAKNILVTDTLNEDALAQLKNGGKVLLTVGEGRLRNDGRARVALGFSSIFWNTAWTARQAPTTLGILCDPKHPALAQFPTDNHSNWQWWYLIHQAQPILMDELPASLRPVVQVVDDWVTNHRLGLVFEAKVGRGSLLMCGIDLKKNADTNPVARQMLHSLLSYMAGNQFKPLYPLSVEQVQGLFAAPSVMQKLGAHVLRASSFETGYEAAKAIDGDPATFWHTQWTGKATAYPYELVLELDHPSPLRGFTLLPRQDGNPNGRIENCALYVTDDPQLWGNAVFQGVISKDDSLKELRFNRVVKGRYVRLEIFSSHQGFASLAELNLVAE